MKLPLLYIGATDSPTACEWLNHVHLDEIAQKVLNGDISLPGLSVKPADPPQEVLASAPDAPQLNLRSMAGGSLTVPDATVKLWSPHDSFGESFQALMKEIVDEFGEPIIAEATANKVKSDDPGPSPPKKLRVTPPLQLQACDSLPANHLAQSAVSGLKKDMQGKIVLRIALDSTMWVLNNSSSVQTLPPGTILASFGAGIFKHVPRLPEGKAGPADPQTVLFDLVGSQSHVFHNSKMMTLQEVVMSAQKTRSSAEVCYHEVTASPTAEDAAAFSLTRKHDVYYKPNPRATATPEENGNEVKGTGSMAGLIPVSKLSFEERGLCAILWTCKWVTKGLTPVKPHVATVVSVELPPNTAAKLS